VISDDVVLLEVFGRHTSKLRNLLKTRFSPLVPIEGALETCVPRIKSASRSIVRESKNIGSSTAKHNSLGNEIKAISRRRRVKSDKIIEA
jgi:hypothetical protein